MTANSDFIFLFFFEKYLCALHVLFYTSNGAISSHVEETTTCMHKKEFLTGLLTKGEVRTLWQQKK